MVLVKKTCISFSILLFVISCTDDNKKMESCDDSILNQNETKVDCGGQCSQCLPTAEFYFNGMIDEQPVLLEEMGVTAFASGLSGWAISGESCSGSYSSKLGNVADPDWKSEIEISFYNLVHISQPCDTEDFKDIFFSNLSLGDCKLSFYDPEITTVGITYYDENGDRWSSIWKDQPEESSFTVESTNFIGFDSSGKKIQKVVGSTSCYLYNGNSAFSVDDSLFVSNAQFVYRFISH